MTDACNHAIQYAAGQKQRNLADLVELLKIPSVSTDPEHQADMSAAAAWLAGELKKLGFKKVNVYPTEKHPVIFGEFIVSPSLPTVLIYGHYDVQPAEPLELWESPAFQPTQRGENLYARGASDMKGQVMATLAAVRAVLQAGTPPVNLKYILEGEEEIGSPSLPAFLKQHKDLLACTFALNADGGMIAADLPTIIYSLRGLAYFELRGLRPRARSAFRPVRGRGPQPGHRSKRIDRRNA